ncbi:MAG: heavy-metal-associated domain-containing protein [Phascolarctobacterium sp.]|nr:heavy-metal-associated domain-containing protein [Phascolarctobacterium sp.]MBQ7760022.1 heavy-metal-associated domain-containing protein [Acidaminococcaceae bacterium]
MVKQIRIDGMHCMHCVGAVKTALEKLAGVTKVEVSLDEARALVEAEAISDEALREAIEDIGFDVVEIK